MVSLPGERGKLTEKLQVGDQNYFESII